MRFPDGRWHGVPELNFSPLGVHTIVRARDLAGNWTVASPFNLLVKNRNDPPRFITHPMERLRQACPTPTRSSPTTMTWSTATR